MGAGPGAARKEGALTLYVQKDSRGAHKESDWLSVPDGHIYLVMGLTWPKTGTPSIHPPPCARTWRPLVVMRP